MAKKCNGKQNNQAVKHRNSRSFAEGLNHRAKGNGAGSPLSDNPHQKNSDDYDAWRDGWNIANDSAGGKIDFTRAPCAANINDNVPASVVVFSSGFTSGDFCG